MRFSLNQIEQNVRKAVRGAGLNWGLAEEAGRSVRWLESVDLPGVHQLANHIQKVDHVEESSLLIEQSNGHWRALEGAASPLLIGPSLADCVNGGSLGAAGNHEIYADRILAISNVDYPLLCAGYTGVASARSGRFVRMAWDSIKVYSCPDGLGFSGNRRDLEVASTTLIEAQILEPDELLMKVFWESSHEPCSVNSEDWSTLEKYAHRTYVEATEASRLAGAGAGLSDND